MTDQYETRTVEALFQIIDFNETVYGEPETGPKLTRVRIRKTYSGVIEGSGVVEVLTAQGDSGAGFVASERIEGVLEGRPGTFVIQHGGVAQGDTQSTYGSIVPGSGTGELVGIAGRAVEAQQAVLTLTYTL
ncbi:uncharacterized protein DUF3224 [Nocardia tenerifensis]|uniref:Uncharacterized protein DUF3224 n=1 Tax=Nocardia tenerifensis TaxID=228006 RepID=A0A318JQH4_9NOCA|nr:DUF3224 domain-containing protein [Nocardia tenerifensis]PXX55647.1 uncharacterized protein DUF3224 [Nocardia tenerifensis]